MRAVLYSDIDMEPITVIELESWAWDYLRERGRVRLAVILPAQFSFNAPPPDHQPMRTVDITAELLVRNHQRHLMLFTRDEEAALLLRSELLPGQHRGVQERERQAFARGFLQALNMLGR